MVRRTYPRAEISRSPAGYWLMWVYPTPNERRYIGYRETMAEATIYADDYVRTVRSISHVQRFGQRKVGDDQALPACQSRTVSLPSRMERLLCPGP